MIISHSRRFIFIKTHKTAGTSLEIVLSRYCGEGDVITPLSFEEENQRREAGGLAPRNYGIELKDYSWNQRMRYAFTRRPIPRFRAHMQGWHVRREVGPEIWDSYFKFAVVRHPIDRCMSRFYYTRDYDIEHDRGAYWDVNDFDQFIRYRAGLINENWLMYTERDEVVLDYLVKYEDLEAGLAVVSEKIGIDHNIYDDLSRIHAKGSHRPKEKKAADVISDRHRMLISTLCEKEIDLFDYKV
jgi:hypothetical protein